MVDLVVVFQCREFRSDLLKTPCPFIAQEGLLMGGYFAPFHSSSFFFLPI